MRAWIAALLLTGAPASAQDEFVEVGGRTYHRDSLDGRALLISPEPPADEVMLTADCAAFHPDVGDGTWGWDAGGFSVMFAETELRFEGQPAPLDAPGCGN